MPTRLRNLAMKKAELYCLTGDKMENPLKMRVTYYYD